MPIALRRTSLPSRERGLKLYTFGPVPRIQVSLPSRERGLKYRGQHRVHHVHGRSLHGSVD